MFFFLQHDAFYLPGMASASTAGFLSFLAPRPFFVGTGDFSAGASIKENIQVI